MTERRPPRTARRGVPPTVAGLLLAAGLGLCAVTVLPQLAADAPIPTPVGDGGARQEAGESGLDGNGGGDGPMDGDGQAVPRGADLLAVFGSYARSKPVPMVFCAAAAAPASTPNGPLAAPLAEPSRPLAEGAWRGPDPASMRVTLLMVGAEVQRAVVDGRVVGVGDVVAAGRVVSIQKDLLRVQVGERFSTYDLEDEWPREFRRELALRRARSGAVGGASPAQEKNQ